MLAARPQPPSIRESLEEYGRGIAGGFLFSLPLLFTMEVWRAGFTVSPLRLLAGLAGTYILLCGFNAFAGLRHDSTAKEIAIDSVEELVDHVTGMQIMALQCTDERVVSLRTVRLHGSGWVGDLLHHPVWHREVSIGEDGIRTHEFRRHGT